jgi:predicted nucleic acid-binding protein
LTTAGPILPDTDVLVDSLQGHSEAIAFVNVHQTCIILSSIAVAELYAGVKGDAELAMLRDFVSLFRVVPVSAENAELKTLNTKPCPTLKGLKPAYAK